jgi:predicted nuclease of predicted toxin-antitoxin system
MSFLADENFPRPAVAALREKGFDISWIVEDAAGLPDELVLARCINEKRTLLTLDKAFGELAFRRGLPSECGVILFRAKAKSPTELVPIILSALAARDDWEGFFTVISRDRIRMTPIT